MDWETRIANYVRETRFPRSPFVAEDGRVVGTWIMGNDYRVKSAYYGGYPAGYLRRIRALFPDKQRALHLFSGKGRGSVLDRMQNLILPIKVGSEVASERCYEPAFPTSVSILEGILLNAAPISGG